MTASPPPPPRPLLVSELRLVELYVPKPLRRTFPHDERSFLPVVGNVLRLAVDGSLVTFTVTAMMFIEQEDGTLYADVSLVRA